MARKIINTKDDIKKLAGMLSALKLPITVEWVQGRDRTKDQNALQFLWASEVARQFGDRDAIDVQAEWKMQYAVPILRDASAKFRAEYDEVVKPLPYESKVKLMRMGFPVTRRMKVSQMVQYLDTVQRECQQMGLHLTDPDPMLSDYMESVRKRAA